MSIDLECDCGFKEEIIDGTLVVYLKTECPQCGGQLKAFANASWMRKYDHN